MSTTKIISIDRMQGKLLKTARVADLQCPKKMGNVGLKLSTCEKWRDNLFILK
jgi:hypothetical protein